MIRALVLIVFLILPVLLGAQPVIADEDLPQIQIVLKLQDNSGMMAHGDAWVPGTGQMDADPLAALLAEMPGLTMTPLFSRPAPTLAIERARGMWLGGQRLADLNAYFRLLPPPGTSREEAAQFVARLNALPLVQTAYIEPEYVPAMIDIPPTTPNFTAQQGYHAPAPAGINLAAAWAYPGGSGQGVTLVDVEGGWHFDHEDLPIDPGHLLHGINFETARDHGTAIVGIIAAGDNGYGITGISPAATVRLSSVFGSNTLPNIADAINVATAATRPGDVIVLELQSHGPASGETCTCACDQFEMLPMEYWQANFDAVQHATASGRIVITVAGNGSMWLDHPRYGGAFNRAVRDSGALFVAASTDGAGREPTCWTNHGSRIDLHSWGENVVTSGYGGLFGTDANQRYTAVGGGTSTAAAIVTGAVLALQGVARAHGATLSLAQVRELLTTTGTPQAASTRTIGPQPDLDAALSQMFTGGQVIGTVRDAGGSPISGATVSAVGYGSVTSGADGRYTLTNLPLLHGVTLAVQAPGYARTWWPDSPTVDGAAVLSLTLANPTVIADWALRTGASVSGTVYDASSGAGVAQVAVQVAGWPDGVCTGPGGAYTLDGLHGNVGYVVSAGGPGCDGPQLEHRWWPGVYQADAAPLIPGDGQAGIDFSLRPQVVVQIDEQMWYQGLAAAMQAAQTPLSFALVDATPGGLTITLRLASGENGTAHVTLMSDERGLVAFRLSSINPTAGPLAEAARRDLPALLAHAFAWALTDLGHADLEVEAMQSLESGVQVTLVQP